MKPLKDIFITKDNLVCIEDSKSDEGKFELLRSTSPSLKGWEFGSDVPPMTDNYRRYQLLMNFEWLRVFKEVD